MTIKQVSIDLIGLMIKYDYSYLFVYLFIYLFIAARKKGAKQATL